MEKTAKITALCNQKGGVGKTTTAANLGIGLAREGKRVLLVDVDPQSSLTASLGYRDQDKMEDTLADVMERTVSDGGPKTAGAIVHHERASISSPQASSWPDWRRRSSTSWAARRS